MNKYYFNPDGRAERYINVTHNAPIEFCKSYWQLGEQKFMHIFPAIFGQKVEVCHLFDVKLKPLKIYSKTHDKEIDVPMPKNHQNLDSVACRLVSSKRRGTMIGQRISSEKLSDSIMIHCHGGGWTCQRFLILFHFL